MLGLDLRRGGLQKGPPAEQANRKHWEVKEPGGWEEWNQGWVRSVGKKGLIGTRQYSQSPGPVIDPPESRKDWTSSQ